MDPIISYGLQEGKLIHISKVENGIRCNCICPECGTPLIAKANKIGINYKKIPHFAHSNDIECKKAYETTLHLLAKEVLLESKTIQLPDFHYDYNPKNSFSKFDEFGLLEFDSLKEEILISTPFGDIIADIFGEKKSRPLIIEFAKTHFVDQKKRLKIKAKNISTIEINLKNQILDRESLKVFFKTKSIDIYWIYNKLMEEKYQKYLDIEKQKNEKFKLEKRINLENEKAKIDKAIKDGYLIFDVSNEFIHDCPLNEERKNEFINSEYFKIPILKKAYTDPNWDGMIHGSIHSGFFIILNKEKIPLYNSYREEDHKRFVKIYNGLTKIQETKKISCYKICRKCKYHRKEVEIEGKDFLICGFK